MNQDTPVIELKGVGEKTQKLLEKLNKSKRSVRRDCLCRLWSRVRHPQ